MQHLNSEADYLLNNIDIALSLVISLLSLTNIIDPILAY